MIKINPFTQIFTTNVECHYMFRYHQAKTTKAFQIQTEENREI